MKTIKKGTENSKDGYYKLEPLELSERFGVSKSIIYNSIETLLDQAYIKQNKKDNSRYKPSKLFYTHLSENKKC
jgi:predicted transcriptional regulator